MSRSPLPPQLSPIGLYASLLDLPGNTDLLARFLSLHQLAAMHPRSCSGINLGRLGTASCLCCHASTIGSCIGGGCWRSGMPHWCCQSWCGHSRAVTPCLSSCCYHDIVISLQISLSPSTSGTVRVSSLRRRVRFRHTADHCYSLVIVQNILDEPPKVRVLVASRASSGSGASREGIGPSNVV